MEKIIDETELGSFLGRVEWIVDARSPAEYAEDHIPGAINVPVLTDAQRQEVGTLHRTNAFEARKLGATYITLAIHNFLNSGIGRELNKSTRLLVYCARGGMRSGSLGMVLSSIGFPVFRLARGYKSYRAYVLNQLEKPLPGPVNVLYGYTGSGKTRILEQLRGEVNVLDLEGCAKHRGSLLGDLPGYPQPSQCAFETALAQEIAQFVPGRPVLIEGESRKIGRLTVPRQLFQQMRAGVQLWLELPRSERVRYILEDYAELKDPTLLAKPMSKLERYLPGSLIQEMRAQIAAGSWPEYVEALLEHHYDPLYARPNKTQERVVLSASRLVDAVAVVRTQLMQGAV